MCPPPTDVVLRTNRLVIRPATPDHLAASLGPLNILGSLLDCRVPADWPPRHWERGPVEWLLTRMAEHPIEPFWKAWFVSLQSPAFPASSVDVPTLVGTIGFKGPPGPPASDTHGVIEVGYSVVTSHWRRGIASEGVAALLAWAGDDPRVRTFRAHTLANDPASAGVLLRNHFTRTATLNDPDDGLIDRYERPAVSP